MDSTTFAIMLAAAYAFGTILIIFTLNIKKYFVKPIKNAKLSKNGISFCSHSRHKIRVGKVKFLEVKNVVYLKLNNKTIIIKNVLEPVLKGEYLYFKADGHVKIIFNAKSFYKYFNIEIKSPTFDLTALKNAAIDDVLNNLFNLNNCNQLKHYLKIVIDILNIKITDNKVIVKRNNFNLTFQLTYKLNNTIKKVNVGESF